MKGEVLKGHVDLLLLAAVEAGPAHGYAIIKTLRERTDAVLNLPEGTLYPALQRLQSGGLLHSSWSTVDGRRRRVYELTDAGREALRRERSDWGTFARAVESAIEPAS
jgi:DNA-binding PadR family transcriptional regulator